MLHFDLIGCIVIVSLSESDTKNVNTDEPDVVFSFTLPVCGVTIEPGALVVLKTGAVFGVTRIKIVADEVTNPSFTVLRMG